MYETRYRGSIIVNVKRVSRMIDLFYMTLKQKMST